MKISKGEASKKVGNKRTVSRESAILSELKSMNKTLNDIRLILDNTWREIRP